MLELSFHFQNRPHRVTVAAAGDGVCTDDLVKAARAAWPELAGRRITFVARGCKISDGPSERGRVTPADLKSGEAVMLIAGAAESSADPAPTVAARSIEKLDRLGAALRTCSALYASSPLNQPKFAMTRWARAVTDGPVHFVCGPCAHSCWRMQDIDVVDDPAVLATPFRCECCLIRSQDHKCYWAEERSNLASPLGFEAALQAESDSFIEEVVTHADAAQASAHSAKLQRFVETIRSTQSVFEQYFEPEGQAAAIAVVPMGRICERAEQREDATHLHDNVLKELLRWFKHDFFTWVSNAPCNTCNSTETQMIGLAPTPLPEERQSMASTIELYRCQRCDAVTRFPRYRRPTRLLTWRKGRCGEWASCFAFIAISLGYAVRFVHDWTDHVWVEVWSGSRDRWIHCDPCEEAFDAPLMYEKGWGKKLNHIVAISREEVVDVARRYSAKTTTLPRRKEFGLSEAHLSRVLRGFNHAANGRIAVADRALFRTRAAAEAAELALGADHCRARVTVLESAQDVASADAATNRARQTGGLEWTTSRGEAGIRGAYPSHDGGAPAAATVALSPESPAPPPPSRDDVDVAVASRPSDFHWSGATDHFTPQNGYTFDGGVGVLASGRALPFPVPTSAVGLTPRSSKLVAAAVFRAVAATGALTVSLGRSFRCNVAWAALDGAGSMELAVTTVTVPFAAGVPFAAAAAQDVFVDDAAAAAPPLASAPVAASRAKGAVRATEGPWALLLEVDCQGAFTARLASAVGDLEGAECVKWIEGPLDRVGTMSALFKVETEGVFKVFGSGFCLRHVEYSWWR